MPAMQLNYQNFLSSNILDICSINLRRIKRELRKYIKYIHSNQISLSNKCWEERPAKGGQSDSSVEISHR